MSAEYKELVRSSTKGDKAALKALFSLGESALAEKDVERAAAIFRDSAISYRIAAYGDRIEAEQAAGKANWLAQSCEIYRAWIEQYPGGRRELPRPVRGIDRESIRKTLLEDVLPDESLRPVLSFLQSALNQAGVVFSSPGGSFQRWVWNYLVWVMEDESYRFPEEQSPPGELSIDVRVGLDFVIDEVENRWRQAEDRE